MKSLFAVGAVAALTLLCGCNKAAEAAAANAQAALPLVAAGKWTANHATDGGDNGFPDKRCLPERSLWEIMDVGVAGLGNCKRTIEKTGAGYVARYQCRSNGSDIAIKATVTGDLKTNFHMESVQTFTPALYGTTRQTIAIRAERTGDC